MSNNIIDFLRTHIDDIKTELSEVVKRNKFDYKTFWTSIEPFIIEIIIKKLIDNWIISSNEYKESWNKNIFPDLTIMPNGWVKIAMEIKSWNHSRKTWDSWGTTNNSENDMGTLNKWEEKIKTFWGENIYYLFIEYNFNDNCKEIIDIKIDNFYRFLWINWWWVLKYREKDWNLRPKNFDSPSLINSFEQFTDLFRKTEIYRSKNIIKKHLENIPKEDRRGFIDGLLD